MTTQFRIEFDWNNDTEWVDEAAYVIHWHADRGFSKELLDPVARPGWCDVTLNNRTGRFTGDSNSSPLFANIVPGRPFRVVAVVSAVDYPVFYGFIQKVVPAAGEDGTRIVRIHCVDGVQLLQDQNVSVALLQGATASEIIEELLTLAVVVPAGTIDPTTEQFGYAGDQWAAAESPFRKAIDDAARSEVGRFYVSNQGQGEFRNRQDLFRVTGEADLSIATPGTLLVENDAVRILNDVSVIIHPRDSTGAIDTLGRALGSLRIPAASGGSPGVRRVKLRFRDPVTGRFSGGSDLVLPLVPVTDYLINERSDGTGVDYTSSPYVTVSTEDQTGTSIVVKFESTTTGTLQVNFLQVRGRSIVSYDPITLNAADSYSQTNFLRRSYRRDLPLSGSDTLGQSLATYLVDQYKLPFTEVVGIEYFNRDTVNGEVLWQFDLLARVKVYDAWVFPDNDPPIVRILGVEVIGDARGFLLRWRLERVDFSGEYWVLSTSRLGETTRLAV